MWEPGKGRGFHLPRCAAGGSPWDGNRSGVALAPRAAAGTALAHGCVENGDGAAYAGLDGDGLDRAVAGAGAAFHAGIAVADMHLAVAHGKDLVRADLSAAAATDAALHVELQRRDVFQIAQRWHRSPLYRAIHSVSPAAPATRIAGMARRISRRTPESDV